MSYSPQQPAQKTRNSWAITILAAPQGKYGPLMIQLALRALHWSLPHHHLHDSSRCGLCLPDSKYFTQEKSH